MRLSPFANRPFGSLLVALPIGVLPSSAGAQFTQWTGTVGNWGEPSSWSDGEPTAGIDAEVPYAATITINQVGEVCRDLTTGTVSGGSAVMIQSGTLTDIGATEGTYLILTGSPHQGTFDSEFLPPGWSWRVEGTSLLVTKGGGVPVQPTTWGVVKSRHTR